MEPAQLSDQIRVGHLGSAGQHQVLTRPAPPRDGRQQLENLKKRLLKNLIYNMLCPPSLPSLIATLVLCKCKESIHCPRSYLFENGICSCRDKLHGAPGWETGQFCPILAVPLGTATINPLGHFVFCSCFGIYYHI